MHHVERAIFDLRRGVPVLIESDEGDRLIAPVEGLDSTLLVKLFDGAAEAPRLILTDHRLARLGCEISSSSAALALDPARDTRESIIELACAPQARLDTSRGLEPLAAGDEAGLHLMRRSLLVPAAVVAAPSPAMAEELAHRVQVNDILAVTASDVALHYDGLPSLLRRVSEAEVPLEAAPRSRFVVFREPDGLREHIAILIGDDADWADPVPVRLHSACLTGDLFGSLRCDCGPQLRASVTAIAERGGGVLLYLAQEGRGIGLANKMRAYQMQDEGLDTVDADQVLGFGKDERDYTVAREMLTQLAVEHIDLLTNNPAKLDAMNQTPIDVAGRSSVFGRLTEQNRRYLATKATRAGHWLDAILAEPDDLSVTK